MITFLIAKEVIPIEINFQIYVVYGDSYAGVTTVQKYVKMVNQKQLICVEDLWKQLKNFASEMLIKDKEKLGDHSEANNCQV